MSTEHLLLEIGTEELPPTALALHGKGPGDLL